MSYKRKESHFMKNIHPLLKRFKSIDPSSNNSNYAVLKSIDQILKDTEEEAILSKVYTAMNTAPDEYLDIYGDYFGVFRKDNETDDYYRHRIVERISIPRGTNDSLIQATRRYLEDANLGVEVLETWRKVFKTNNSTLNGDDHLLGDIYNVAVIDILVGGNFPLGLVEELNNFKPAGVNMFITYTPDLQRLDGQVGTRVTNALDYVAEDSRFTQGSNGLNTAYIGDVKLSNKVIKSNNGLFVVNDSELNSLKELGRVFDIYSDTYHVLSTANDTYPLSHETSIETIQTEQDVVDTDSYSKLDKTDNGDIAVKTSLSDAAYFTYDVYYHLSTLYPTTDLTTILDNSDFLINSKQDIDRASYSLQVYNYATKTWDALSNRLSSRVKHVISGRLTNSQDYINRNGILSLRLNPTKEMVFTLDNVTLRYNHKVDHVVEHNYGYTAKNAPTIVQDTARGIGDAIIGESFIVQ